MKNSQIYIKMPSLNSTFLMEGFGLPVVEAMSQKCLVLASDIPGSSRDCW